MFSFPLTKKLATTQDRQILQSSDEKQDCQFCILRLVVFTRFPANRDCLLKLYISGSQPGCRGTLGRHLQYPGVPRANTFFIISLKRYFQNVAKTQSKLLWVRH